MLVYLVVFSVLWKAEATDLDDYWLFLLCGLPPWVFLARRCRPGRASLVENAPLIRKVRFPRQLVPLSVVATQLVAFADDDRDRPRARALVPAGEPRHRVARGPGRGRDRPLRGGLALAVAALNAVFRDVEFVVAAVLLPWFFLTPVLYQLDDLPGAESRPWLIDLIHWGKPADAGGRGVPDAALHGRPAAGRGHALPLRRRGRRARPRRARLQRGRRPDRVGSLTTARPSKSPSPRRRPGPPSCSPRRGPSTSEGRRSGASEPRVPAAGRPARSVRARPRRARAARPSGRGRARRPPIPRRARRGAAATSPAPAPRPRRGARSPRGARRRAAPPGQRAPPSVCSSGPPWTTTARRRSRSAARRRPRRRASRRRPRRARTGAPRRGRSGGHSARAVAARRRGDVQLDRLSRCDRPRERRPQAVPPDRVPAPVEPVVGELQAVLAARPPGGGAVVLEHEPRRRPGARALRRERPLPPETVRAAPRRPECSGARSRATLTA